MKYNTVKRWRVMKLTEDGHLKDPENQWGDPVFNPYGYDSEDEAVEAIVEDERVWEHIFLIPMISHVPDYE